MYQAAARWLPSTVGASNAWAVAPRRTSTGRAILCNDPHLEPTLPSVWFAAHVRAGDDFESTGVTFAGQPFPIIGHNRRIAWGYTNSFADCQDLVIEQFDAPAGNRFRTEDGWVQSRVVREVIRVKDRPDEVEEVVITRHGPVVERCDDVVGGRWLGLALQWTALTPGCASEAVLKLQRAGRLGQLSQSLRHAGRSIAERGVRRRRRPHRLLLQRAHPGASGGPCPGCPRRDGTATCSGSASSGIDEVPQALDPPEGLVITANNRIVGDAFPHYIANDYMAGYRALRLERAARPRQRWTPRTCAPCRWTWCHHRRWRSVGSSNR